MAQIARLVTAIGVLAQTRDIDIDAEPGPCTQFNPAALNLNGGERDFVTGAKPVSEALGYDEVGDDRAGVHRRGEAR